MRNANAPLEKCNDSHYMFATFLQPGYHQFFIFDPLTDKIYCQECVVEFNTCHYIYPELPTVNKGLLKSTLPNVFKKWIKDDAE